MNIIERKLSDCAATSVPRGAMANRHSSNMISRNLIAERNSTSKDRFPWSLPFRPISSSDQQRWEGFSVRHYRSPAFEVAEHPMTVHRLQIQLGRPIKLEAIEEGRLLKG